MHILTQQQNKTKQTTVKYKSSQLLVAMWHPGTRQSHEHPQEGLTDSRKAGGGVTRMPTAAAYDANNFGLTQRM